MTSKPFYIKETYPAYDFDFQARIDVFNRRSPFLIRHLNNIQAQTQGFADSTENFHSPMVASAKTNRTETDEALPKSPKEFHDIMKIRPMSVCQRRTQLETTSHPLKLLANYVPTLANYQLNSNKKEKPYISDKYHETKNANTNPSIKLNENSTNPKINERERPMSFKYKSSTTLLHKIRNIEKMNLHNLDYLKSFYFAYDNKIKDSVTMGMSVNSLKTASKHLKPELYLKFLKAKSMKNIQEKKEKMKRKTNNLKPNFETRKFQMKKDTFFVVLSGDKKEEDRVPIIHGSNQCKSKM